MAVDGIRSFYLETHNFGKTVAFWKQLGYEVFMDLGPSVCGMRTPAGGTYLFVEEVGPDRSPASEPYFNVTERDFAPGDPVEVVTPWEDTHWDTRLCEVRDPDGRIWKLEDAGQQFPEYS